MRKLWLVIVFGVVVAAAIQAGPTTAPERAVAVVGADPDPPPTPDCNGINNYNKDCPPDSYGGVCGNGTRQRNFNSADPGGVNNMRYDKTSTPRCRHPGDPACPVDTVDYDTGTMGCTPQKVPNPG